MEKNRGFTLIELSIVLLAIGLLLGGVLLGQNLINSSRATKVIFEVEQLMSAAREFKVAYKYFPGDLPNAYKHFGDDCGPDTEKSGASFENEGCNGDGNGRVSYSAPAEGDNFFLHLSMAGMMDKTYTSLQTDQAFLRDINIPGSAISGSVYGPWIGHTAPNASAQALKAPYGLLLFNVNGDTINAIENMRSISPYAAKNIDNKIDDGFPNSGYVMAVGYWHLTDCVKTGTVYVLTNRAGCSLSFYPRKEHLP